MQRWADKDIMKFSVRNASLDDVDKIAHKHFNSWADA
ncbi:hypothetical protein ACOMICROBIO_EPCKBFOG_03897 [Vibrio sp. B1FLJ16]|nr:hypothetical protein ACOMICROBIO_EPCKBFOG_03897 [Vibrio sp. B1FLJ16]CAE6943494.1 hypothetical protein ACOMICROBIO_EPCKBFOG_03897 [Vibrio sp. B1FLJ16]